jgi:predicted short-subunit dehydrogenase-like oxidoreductase (DUF2520 family)
VSPADSHARGPGIAVVGPGRAGSCVAAALELAGHRIAAVAGGSDASRARFRARFPGATGDVTSASTVLVATPDDVLEQVVSDLVAKDAIREGQCVVHLSGALGLGPLRRAGLAGARVAACHPAQTIPGADADPGILTGVAWAVTARPDDRRWAHDLVRDAGGNPYDVAEADRTLYHAGLTLGSNAAGAAVSLARRLLLAARVADPAAFLAPLVEASVRNVLADGASAITGPVRRGDAGTLARHLDALADDLPEAVDAYRDLSRTILSQVRAGMDPAAVAAVEAVLDADAGR